MKTKLGLGLLGLAIACQLAAPAWIMLIRAVRKWLELLDNPILT